MSVHRDVVGTPSTPLFAEWILQGNLATTGGQDKKCLNVFHFHRATGSGTPNEADLDTALWTILKPHLEAATVLRYTVPRRTLRLMDDPSRAAVELTATPLTGTLEDDGYASDSAVYMQLLTGARGRNFLGSKHFGGFSEEDTENDQLDASGITNWGAVKTDLVTFATTGVTSSSGLWNMIVLSQSLSDLEAFPSVFTYADITGVALNLTLGTMGGRRQRTVR